MRRRVVAVCIAGLLLIGCGRPLTDPGAASLPAVDSISASTVPGASAVAGEPGALLPSPPPVEASAAGGEAVAEVSQEAAAEAASPPPEAPAQPAPAPTVDPAFAGVQLPPVGERWRYMQMDREVFEPIRTYATSGPETLWWYDPVFGQTVALGEINSEFPVQAVFRLRGQEAVALEVPYQINTSFGLRLPDALQTRMRNAGASEWVETFVLAKSDVQAR